MTEGRSEIGICGTFDVANYGDLLFPLIAEWEITSRLGPVTLHRFSYMSKTAPDWPYDVTSIAELPEKIHRLDGLLIGGGFLVRFDKQVAPGYLPPTPQIHHPTGYWLTPILIALQHNVPVMWNAPGMHCNEIPKWANPLIDLALTLSRYVSVRDEPSRMALAHLTTAPLAVVPDTAFRIPELLNLDGPPSAEFAHISQACGLDRPYIVIQATLGSEGFVCFLKRHAERLRNFRILALPIGPALGERADIIDADLPGMVRLSSWPHPLVIGELIGRSQAVVGHSYHFCITALACGVPVFTRQNLSVGKYSMLQDFESVFILDGEGEPDIDWFLSRVGKTTPSAAARATYKPLEKHWDRIADALRAGPPQTAPFLNRFWQSLPALLEDAAIHEDHMLATQAQERHEAQARLYDAMTDLAAARDQIRQQEDMLESMTRRLTAARAETSSGDARIAHILASASWKLSAPIRLLGRHRRKLGDDS